MKLNGGVFMLASEHNGEMTRCSRTKPSSTQSNRNWRILAWSENACSQSNQV